MIICLQQEGPAKRERHCSKGFCARTHHPYGPYIERVGERGYGGVCARAWVVVPCHQQERVQLGHTQSRVIRQNRRKHALSSLPSGPSPRRRRPRLCPHALAQRLMHMIDASTALVALDEAPRSPPPCLFSEVAPFRFGKEVRAGRAFSQRMTERSGVYTQSEHRE